MSMFSIRIDNGLRADHRNTMHRQPSIPQCGVDVIMNCGYSFEQALKLINPLATRKAIQSSFEKNRFSISKEEIEKVANDHNIVL